MPKGRNKKGHFTERNAKKFGALGGKARRKKLTRAQRSAIARVAGLARHGLDANGKPATP